MSDRLIYGLAKNDADYVTQRWTYLPKGIEGKIRRKAVWSCPYHTKWANMLARCYSKTYHANHATYKDCEVCEEWLTFSNFKRWVEQQVVGWENMHLDKDFLFEGNTVYSPSTCIFITQEVNKFIIDRGASRGNLLLGVTRSVLKTHFRPNVVTL